MPTSMSYTRIVRPKNRKPKYTIKQGVTYNISKNTDGTPKITKTVYRKIYVNKG